MSTTEQAITEQSGEALAPAMFGKFVASPNGEPTAKDPRERVFDTEAEARDYALDLLPTLRLAEARADRPFVAVLEFRDDDESRDAARENAADGLGAWPLWTPYGWADDRGYVAGSFEDSAYLWGGEPYAGGEGEVVLARPIITESTIAEARERFATEHGTGEGF